jgi:ribosome assembly protein 1
MPVVTPEKLVSLQRNPDGIRNICILAHVDHGKTSLTDALLATNGIISPKLAGKIRYLDSRPDEQLRGITMESSAISLYFSMMRRRPAENGHVSTEPNMEEYLINLIDSPGHIDFQSEVSTASRLCDGAVVLVDAVEGVCSQTITVLRQTWIEKLTPLLVINKMDRLITELRMTPGEAYIHLSKLLEQVNAVMGSFFQGERMDDDLRWRERMEERVTAAAARIQERDASSISDDASQPANGTHPEREYVERDDEDIYFAPENNNVIFSSALDGWAFTVKQFAGLYEKKLGIKRTVLEKVLWGDFYLDPKTKRVLRSKHLKGRNLKPMFVQLVLDNIWAVYHATLGDASSRGDAELLNKILKSLSITLPAHILNSRVPHNILTTLFAKWLPLSTALLVSVIEHLPSPPTAQAARMPALLDATPGSSHISPDIRAAVTNFDQEDSKPVLVFISKMVAVQESELPRNKRQPGGTLTAEEARELARKKRAELTSAKATGTSEDDGRNMAGLTIAFSDTTLDDQAATPQKVEEDPEHLIGFARIYSGTLKAGSEVYVLPPKYSPAHPEHPPAIAVKIEALYLLMGRALEHLDSVPAGSIFGIEGISSVLLKQGTICSVATGAPNLAGISGSQIAPIVRVALEPVHPADLEKMISGLKMLERSDPCAVYEVLESGEHVLATAGELHLERCLKDLRERFAKCEIQSGEPIVPYREGIVNASSVTGEIAIGPRGTAVVDAGKGGIQIKLRVRPLPVNVMEYLVQNSSAVKKTVGEKHSAEETTNGSLDQVIDTAGEKDTGRSMTAVEFETGLRQAFEAAKGEKENWQGVVDRILAFGPRRVGPNLLLDNTPEQGFGKPIFTSDPEAAASKDERQSILSGADLSNKIMHAFQLSTQQGPLCHEPVQGIAVSIESFSFSPSPLTDSTLPSPELTSRLTSEVIKSAREAIRAGFLEYSPRLYLAMYLVDISATTEVLGRVYPVLTRRHAHILSETLSEASNSYSIASLLPLHESFGFSDEIRKKTSGGASAQMVFHGFEMLDQDPFWVPATVEEIEDLGDTADRENRAKGLVDEIRERKGLLVLGRKLDAEKERNMKR